MRDIGSLSALFLVFACSANEPAPAPRTEGSEAPAVEAVAVAEMAIPETARLPPVDVSVLDAGAEPRAPLRLRTPLGTRGHAALRFDLAMELTMQGRTQPIDVPAMTMEFDQSVIAVAPDGQMRRDFRLSSIDVEPSPATEQIEAMMRPLVGMTGWDVIDPRGRLVAAHFDTPEGASPQLMESIQNMRDTIQQAVVPFPEEPVGVGARWTATTLVQSKVTLSQTATYTLEAVDGDTIRLAIEITQTAEPQTIEAAGGASNRIQRFEGSGQSTTELDLTGIVPQTNGQARVEMESEVLQPGAGPVPMSMVMNIETSMAGSVQELTPDP